MILPLQQLTPTSHAVWMETLPKSNNSVIFGLAAISILKSTGLCLLPTKLACSVKYLWKLLLEASSWIGYSVAAANYGFVSYMCQASGISNTQFQLFTSMLTLVTKMMNFQNLMFVALNTILIYLVNSSIFCIFVIDNDYYLLFRNSDLLSN